MIVAFLFLAVWASALVQGGPATTSVTMQCRPSHLVAEADSRVEFRCLVRNESGVELASDRGYFISYHLNDGSGKLLSWDNPRFPFPNPLTSGHHETVRFELATPTMSGRYSIDLDIVHEHVAWFSRHGARFPSVALRVVQPRPRRLSSMSLLRPRRSIIDSGNPDLDLAWRLVEKTIANDETVFRIRGKQFAAFTAGENYPQIWIRDCATAFDAERWFVGLDALRSCLLLSLSGQARDGSIQDWIDPTGATGKNTVETDQEASLIQLLEKYVASTGDRKFLSRRIAGISILDRAERALEYVWRERLDSRLGLLTSGHTIDWGDVQIGNARLSGRRDQDTPIVAGIYTQAMFVMAVHDLLQLYAIHGAPPGKLKTWDGRANFIENRSREALWDSGRGYFVIHRHVTPLRHPFNEADLFAMGGNAVAIEAGIATPGMARRIFAVALERQKQFGVSTISGVLLPPYRHGTYTYPMVSAPYSYQNGGQWDWFGARLVLAMFRTGHSQLATTKLDEIEAKIARNGGVSEWDNRDGTPGGKGDYAGAAGALARTITEGLFGIAWQGDRLAIALRLGTHPARASFVQPATKNSMGMNYAVDPVRRTVRLVLSPHGIGLDAVSVLLPTDKAAVRNVTWNRRTVGFAVRRIGDDRFVDIAPQHDGNGNAVDLRFEY